MKATKGENKYLKSQLIICRNDNDINIDFAAYVALWRSIVRQLRAVDRARRIACCLLAPSF
jgi:hypothetical protein